MKEFVNKDVAQALGVNIDKDEKEKWQDKEKPFRVGAPILRRAARSITLSRINPK